MTLLEDVRLYAQRHGGVVRLGVQDRDPAGEIRALGHPATDQRLRALLSDLASQGTIRHPARGIYLIPDAFGRVSRWAVAAELGGEAAYLSLWSAADFYELTTSQVGWLSVVGDRPLPSVKLGSLGTVVFHHTDRSRVFGALSVPDGGVFVHVARIERLLIDLLWFSDAPDVPSSTETYAIWKAAAGRSLNGALLADYTSRMNASRLSRRVGYLMEHFGLAGAEPLTRQVGTEKELIVAIPGRGAVTLPPSAKWRVKG
jgi:predicted transcriptional regulator of viral defense system